MEGRESGLDRMDGIPFVLMISSRAAPSARLRASSTRYRAAAFGGRRPLTKSSTRTTSIHAIKAAIRSSVNVLPLAHEAPKLNLAVTRGDAR
jgi:hypothetical protein